MTADEIIRFINSTNLFGIIFKIAAILFAISYLVYSAIYNLQVRKLTRSYSSSGNKLVFSFAALQIAISIILLFYAIVFL